MRPHFTLPLVLLLAACQPQKKTAETASPAASQPIIIPGETRPAPVDIKTSVVRLNSTQQKWNPSQPWEKLSPSSRRALAAIVGPQQVLTSAELVADATYLEFESPDGTRFAKAKVVAVDYEANLALLGPADEEEGKTFFAGTNPLEISDPSAIGDNLDILQIEENGTSLLTAGTFQSIDLAANFLPGQNFLTYQVKASMQDAASSFSLPVLRDGKLAGVLISYDAKDQICDVTATDIIRRFIDGAADGTYDGFPSLGVTIALTEDASFRKWLQLQDDVGGIYVKSVRKGGSADLAGIRQGDVILSIDGRKIDRLGYFEHPNYGSVFWGHLVRGSHATGDVISISLQREGKPLEVKATLTREEESKKLVPGYHFGKAPSYLVKGGFIFQELSRPLLEAFGEEWTSRAPLNLLDAYENPEKYEGKIDRVIFLSGAIPTPATVGYERLRNLIVSKVNGREIKNMNDLISAFNSNLQPLHSIEFLDENLTIYLDENTSTAVDTQLVKRGIGKLSRTN
ncbi:MAG: PDZ domain-containing protein [Luteolibacter sp.]